MPSLGPAEILVVLVVALLVFGPNKMPEIGRQVARGVREFRRVQQHLSNELQNVVSELDPTAPEPASSGGDPVPMLPPKDATDTPEPAPPPQGDSVPMLPPKDATEPPELGPPAPAPGTPTPNPPAAPPVGPVGNANGSTQAEVSDTTGEPPSSPPAERA
jgi:sec-independent protein translocase protein TatA